MKNDHLILALMCIGVFVLSFDLAHAQLFGSNYFDSVEMDMEPSFPGPNEEVTISTRSFSFDLDREVISWFINDTLHSQGRGLQDLKITTGSLGSEMHVRVVVGDDQAEGAVVIRPAQGAVLWEADSYTPPYYRGRAMVSPGTPIRMHAIAHFVTPNGVRIPEENIDYTWSINGRTRPDVSGRGRASIILPASSFPEENRVSVQTISDDYGYAAVARTRIPSSNPHLALYYEHPLTGIRFHKALASTDTLLDTEATILAVPYFTQARTWRDEDLVYTWTVNNSMISVDPFDPNRITLGLEDRETGEAAISLLVEHTNHVLQLAERAWNLVLSQQTTTDPGDPFMRRVDLAN